MNVSFPFIVLGWSLKQKSKFSKSFPVIMLGQPYNLKDQGSRSITPTVEVSDPKTQEYLI